jgi:hypothetical protein
MSETVSTPSTTVTATGNELLMLAEETRKYNERVHGYFA